MSLESAFYTWLLESLPGGDYNRTKVREIVNDVQNEVLGGYDGRLMKIKPEPYLVVTDSSIKKYIANDSLVSQEDGETTYDVRRVARVYAFTNKNNPYGSYAGFGDGLSPFPPIQRNGYAVPEVEFPIEPVDSNRPLLGDCFFRFHRDFSPAISTTIYQAEAWEWPDQLSSESIRIKLPFAFQKTVLLFGVLSKIETRDFGRDDTILPKYENAKKDWYKYDEEATDFRPLRSLPRWA